MNPIRTDEPKAVRLVFELARADNPRLYDELARFPRGAKRVNRLRVLAYDGLLAQYGVFDVVRAEPASPPAHASQAPEHAGVTNSVFAPGIAE